LIGVRAPSDSDDSDQSLVDKLGAVNGRGDGGGGGVRLIGEVFPDGGEGGFNGRFMTGGTATEVKGCGAGLMNIGGGGGT